MREKERTLEIKKRKLAQPPTLLILNLLRLQQYTPATMHRRAERHARTGDRQRLTVHGRRRHRSRATRACQTTCTRRSRGGRQRRSDSGVDDERRLWSEAQFARERACDGPPEVAQGRRRPSGLDRCLLVWCWSLRKTPRMVNTQRLTRKNKGGTHASRTPLP